MIELNQLEQLVCIAKNKTISKAAEELLISQPALSRSMQRLEDDLGVAIFDHYSNRVVLNANGEMMVERAQKILQELEQSVQAVRHFARSHLEVSIACCAPAPIWDLEPLYQQFDPSLHLTSAVIDEEQLIPELKNKTYQLVITPGKINDPEVYGIYYLHEDLYLSLPPGHHLAGREKVEFEDLAGETMLLYSKIGFWQKLHDRTMPYTRFLQQNERRTFNEIVKSSLLPSFTTNLSIKREGKMDERVIVPFSNSEAHVPFYLNCLTKERTRFEPLFQYLKENRHD